LLRLLIAHGAETTIAVYHHTLIITNYD